MLARGLAGLGAGVAVAATLGAVALAGGSGGRDVALIVELEGRPALTAGPGAQADNARVRSQVRAAARDAGVSLQEHHSYSLTFNGLAVTVAEEDRARLAALPGVAAVHPDGKVRAKLGTSVPLVGAPHVWERRDGENRPVTGTGVDVAVIDTGVDGTHPALEGAVVGGHDFVEEDGDPMDDNGHGTHVAGIVAARGEPAGVAPGASILAYKVLNRAGYGEHSDVLAGVETAVKDDADVINLSLGGVEPPDGPLTTAAQTAADAGVTVVAAAGNEGPSEGTVGAPAQAPGVLAVGASTSDVTVPAMRMLEPRTLDLRPVRWEPSANPPQEEREVELVDIGSGDGQGVDVEGKAVLMTAPFPPTEIAFDLEKRGAVALLMHRPGGGGPVAHEFAAGSGDDGRFDRLVAVFVDPDAADDLRAALAEGPVTVGVSGEDVTDTIADFSSRGPTQTFTTKPDLVAPGVDIRSTVPKALHAPGIVRFSGTSMAAPHVAGAAALLRQLHPDWSATAVRSALAGAVEPLPGSALATGAGRLDVDAAADAAVVADATALSFGLTGTEGRVTRSRTLTLENVSAAAQTVRLGAGPSVSVTPRSFALAAGARRTVTVAVTADSPQADIEGALDVDVAGGASDLRVPYSLAVRELLVIVTPDPADNRTEAFIATPAELRTPPTVEVRGPDGITQRVTARHDHAHWYRAVLEGRAEGVYQVRVTAPATIGGATLSGSTRFEVAEPDEHGGSPQTWQPVGPNAAGGEIDTAHDRVYVLNDSVPVVWVSEEGETDQWRSRRVTTMTEAEPIELAPDPRREGSLYLAVNGGPSESTFVGQILHSPDHGRTWTSLPAPDVKFNDVEVVPGGDVLAAAAADGLHVGTRGGAAWDLISGPWSRVNALQLVGDDLFAATDAGLQVVDGFARGGRTARRADLDGPQSVDDVSGNNRLLLAVSFGTVRGSSDGGRTWTGRFAHPEGGRIWAIDVEGTDGYVGAFGRLWVGDRRGTRWQERPLPIDNRQPVTSVAAGGSGLLASVPRSGIFETADGARTYRRVGVPGVPVTDLAFAEQGGGRPWLIAGTKYNVYRTRSPQGAIDLEWGLSGAEGAVDESVRLAPSPSHPRIVYRTVETAIGEFDVQRSDDAGATWRQLGRAMEQATALHVDPHDPDRVIVGFYAFSGSGTMVSEDGGASWRRRGRTAPPAAIAADPRDGDRLWLADGQGLHRSTDGGGSWTLRHEGEFSAVAYDPEDPQRLVAGGRRLVVSDNGGSSFAPAFAGGLELNVAELLYDPDRRGVVYAAADCLFANNLPRAGRGVLRSTDGGRTWSSFSEGLDARCVTSLALAPDGRHLFAGTLTAGAHRIRLTGRP